MWRQGFKAHPSSFVLPFVLTILSIACTWSYYRLGYHQQIAAEERFTQTFFGFHKIEGDPPRVYRWTTGQGNLCLPAAGQQRPALALQLDLLGQSDDLQVREFIARVGATSIILPLEQHDSRYHLLLPPSPEYGPICVELASSARMPEGDERLLGVGFRRLALDRIAVAPPLVPPLDQVGVNLGLALCGYALLRRWRIAGWLAAGLVAAIAVGMTALLISGRFRFAPDLPLMTVGALAALTALFATDVLRVELTRRLRSSWAREWVTIGLTLALLLGAMFSFQALAGYAPGSYPLMARMGPTFSIDVLWSVALFTVWVALILRWLQAEQPPSTLQVVLVSWLAAFGLAVLLKAGLRETDSLFQTFTWQPEDYIRDVRRVGDHPISFLQQYIDMMPRLSRHNRTHPPGSTLFLWLIGQIIGPGPQIATWVVIAISALGVWPTYLLARWAAAPLGSVQRGRVALVAAAIYGVLPAQLIFGATSMDALFATVLATAIYCVARALLPDQTNRGWIYALLAGFWIAVGLLLTFTTLVLGLLGATLAVFLLLRLPWRVAIQRLLVQGLLIGVTTVVLLGGIWATTGYNSWAAFREGNANNVIDVQERTPPPGPATYLFFLGANLVAWTIYLGPWGVNLLARGSYAGLSALQPSIGKGERTTAIEARSDALVAGTAVLLIGLFISGLFVREVERVLLFTHVLVAFAIAYGIIQQRSTLEPKRFTAIVLSALFVQAILMRAVLRIYW